MDQTLNLLIADDHTLFAEGICLLLRNEKNIVIKGIADNGKTLLQLIRKEMPDIVLLDINMPGMDGMETIRRIKYEFEKIKVIMLSTYSEEHLIEKAKTCGANGYLLKNVSKEELINTIFLVQQGQSCFPYRLPVKSVRLEATDSFLKQFDLTRKERELLGYIKQGFTNQHMATHLHLSIYTIETHRKNIMQKLQLNSAAELLNFIFHYDI
jgi:two-component system nitrate/nitrite response regulator NarL